MADWLPDWLSIEAVLNNLAANVVWLVVISLPAATLTYGLSRWQVQLRREIHPSNDGDGVDGWSNRVRDAMFNLWAGDTSPLVAIRSRRANQVFEIKSDLLDVQFRDAEILEDGTRIDISRLKGGPIEAYQQLHRSFLLVGEPGSGKSVFLWQLLESIYNNTDEVPILLEAHEWSDFRQRKSRIPPFTDFVVERLTRPPFGVPRNRARQIAHSAVILLDSCDELGESGSPTTADLFDSLALDYHSTRQRKLVVVSRRADYETTIETRGRPTGVVQVAAYLRDPSKEAIYGAIRKDPHWETLVNVIASCPALASVIRQRLWLSIALDLSESGGLFRASIPPAATEKEVHRYLYRQWVYERIDIDDPKVARPLRFLARRQQLEGLHVLS